MNIDACVVGVTVARQSVMVNDVEDLGCVQQKQYWAQNTALECGTPQKTFETVMVKYGVRPLCSD